MRYRVKEHNGSFKIQRRASVWVDLGGGLYASRASAEIVVNELNKVKG